MINFTLLYFLTFAYGENCQDWFNDSKINPASSACLEKCSALMVDMDTFNCTSKCALFCKSNSCESSKRYWLSKLKDTRPETWPNSTEKSKKWLANEKTKILNTLLALPAYFEKTTLKRKSPQILDWLSKNYSDKLVMRANCK